MRKASSVGDHWPPWPSDLRSSAAGGSSVATASAALSKSDGSGRYWCGAGSAASGEYRGEPGALCGVDAQSPAVLHLYPLDGVGAPRGCAGAVSYTHLTLPTNREV